MKIYILMEGENIERGLTTMLTQKSFKKEVINQTHHEINLFDSECVHTEERRQGDKMFLTCYYLYFDYESNCIVHYKETSQGAIDDSDDVNEVQSVGYEIIKYYSFR